jgi:hypothetical protein
LGDGGNGLPFLRPIPAYEDADRSIESSKGKRPSLDGTRTGVLLSTYWL